MLLSGHVGHVTLHDSDVARTTAAGKVIHLAYDAGGQATQHDQCADSDADSGCGEESTVATAPQVTQTLVAKATQGTAFEVGGGASFVREGFHRPQTGGPPGRGKRRRPGPEPAQ